MKYGSIVEVGIKFLSVKNVGSVKESEWNKFEMIFCLKYKGFRDVIKVRFLNVRWVVFDKSNVVSLKGSFYWGFCVLGLEGVKIGWKWVVLEMVVNLKFDRFLLGNSSNLLSNGLSIRGCWLGERGRSVFCRWGLRILGVVWMELLWSFFSNGFLFQM